MVPRPESELEHVDEERFAEVTALAFQQRRKTLRNALSKVLTEAQIEEAGVNPGARAETLSVHAFVQLARAAAKAKPQD
jgi:16S rRNA (adenine1518-N6/adenine1519-N6)-dimethyltransferase